jgi:hypothetical protein
MGVYPESFLAPMRKDVAVLLDRVVAPSLPAIQTQLRGSPPQPSIVPRTGRHTDGLRR